VVRGDSAFAVPRVLRMLEELDGYEVKFL